MAGGDAGGRSYSETPFPKAPVVRWSYSLNGAEVTEPVAGEDGTVYVATGREVHAVGADGQRRWVWRGEWPILALAVGRHGTIYVRDLLSVKAFSPQGQQEWSAGVESGRVGPTIVGQGGVIYTYSYPNLYAIADDGTVKWRAEVGSFDGGPLETPSGRILMVSAQRLMALDRGGSLLWQQETPPLDFPRSVAVGNDGKIYLKSGELIRVLDEKGEVLSTWAARRQPVHGLAIGNDSLQAGLLRYDLAGAWQWGPDRPYTDVLPDFLRVFSHAMIDSEGNALIQSQTWPWNWTILEGNKDPQTVVPPPHGLRMLDAAGQERWRMEKINPVGPAAVTGDGRICFVGLMQEPRIPTLICIGDP